MWTVTESESAFNSHSHRQACKISGTLSMLHDQQVLAIFINDLLLLKHIPYIHR